MAAHEKPKPVLAYAICNKWHGISLDSGMEPQTEEGRKELTRRINRPAGDRVIPVKIIPQ